MLIVDDVVFDQVQVGVVDAEAVVAKKLVVDVVEVGVAIVVGVVVEEDTNLTGLFGLCIISISLNLFPYNLIHFLSVLFIHIQNIINSKFLLF